MNRVALIAVLFLHTQITQAIIVQVDYSYDAASANFFTQVPAARAAVDAAAADLSAAILPTLSPINTDTFTGTNLATTATINWSINFANPSTGASVTLDVFTPILSDTLTLYVGMQPISGSTLGQGGSVGAGISLNASGVAAQWPGALDNAEAASNAVMARGGGPIIGSLSGQASLGGTTSDYTLRYGAIAGTLKLDNDSDNNGTADTLAQLNNYWHFDPTTPVAAGKNDFYTVALHEMIHALGLGSSQTWMSLHSGTTWLGGNAITLNGGSGANLVSADGSHLADSLMSPRLSDGLPQEVVMDPSILVGTRKYLTQMDLAFLRDLGYVTVPEPSGIALWAAGILCATAQRSRRVR